MTATVTLTNLQFTRLLALATFGLVTHTVRGGEMRRKLEAELRTLVETVTGKET